jgi:hypothetical protein
VVYSLGTCIHMGRRGCDAFSRLAPHVPLEPAVSRYKSRVEDNVGYLMSSQPFNGSERMVECSFGWKAPLCIVQRRILIVSLDCGYSLATEVSRTFDRYCGCRSRSARGCSLDPDTEYRRLPPMHASHYGPSQTSCMSCQPP